MFHSQQVLEQFLITLIAVHFCAETLACFKYERLERSKITVFIITHCNPHISSKIVFQDFLSYDIILLVDVWLVLVVVAVVVVAVVAVVVVAVVTVVVVSVVVVIAVRKAITW